MAFKLKDTKFMTESKTVVIRVYEDEHGQQIEYSKFFTEGLPNNDQIEVAFSEDENLSFLKTFHTLNKYEEQNIQNGFSFNRWLKLKGYTKPSKNLSLSEGMEKMINLHAEFIQHISDELDERRKVKDQECEKNSSEKMICPCLFEGESVCKICNHFEAHKQGFKVSEGIISIKNIDEFVSDQKECIHDWKVVSKDEKLLVTPYEGHPEEWRSVSRSIILSCIKCGKLETITSKG